jgi:hypothetical protein
LLALKLAVAWAQAADLTMSDPNPAARIQAASKGFDHLFQNEFQQALDTFAEDDSPFHLTGMGVVTFLEAALGMEVSEVLRKSLSNSVLHATLVLDVSHYRGCEVS